mmetsp:Transcript_38117/g.107693  ORF Transcript_38117/g.107693 Transcript_38117/m.107693 type:complete len:430 (+) Transcript_38117:280-1569(+)|eukprot:CAMPEP_0117655104 /NCGR_PEP_ID=MMETSP0804-20121206/4102_1 /TAXON_ID=1074897 /ORGANISM="Tetraselmis astigmatica, Strain CCMP880" /LENGTH=429 /DNA_ID=CAMNT_0005461435 /DNA_START=231 /DNA_END=1520 /DNA_ORIENTATION=-
MGQCCSSGRGIGGLQSASLEDDRQVLQGLVRELVAVHRGQDSDGRQELKPRDITKLMDSRDMQALCARAATALLRQPTVLDVVAPVHIVGDIHGQFEDLLRIFDHLGIPPKTKYLFLGDYVDRGPKGLEVMVLLLSLQMLYPEQVFLLRGNHECEHISMMYGFFEECKTRYRAAIWKVFIPVFDAMPIAALVEPSHLPPDAAASQGVRKPLLCVHAGLSRSLTTMAQLRSIPRPLKIHTNEVIRDLVWSDPIATAKGWGFGERGVSCTYGMDVARAFLRHNSLSMIIRAHEVADNGFALLGDHQDLVATVFSAPGYAGVCDNDAAVLEVTAEGGLIWHLMPFHDDPKMPESYKRNRTIVIHSNREVGCLPTRDGSPAETVEKEQQPAATDCKAGTHRNSVHDPAAAEEEPEEEGGAKGDTAEDAGSTRV